PSASVSYDVTRDLSAYVGYTDIYQNQAGSLDADLNPMPPLTGSNIEAGLKWEARESRLNTTLAVYRIRQKGFAMRDPSRLVVENGVTYYVANNGQRFVKGTVDPEHSCCFIYNPNRSYLSEGVDVELTGEVATGWQVSAGYTFNRNKRV